jgi:alpha-galactosidase
MLFGTYTDRGDQTCAGRPGAYGNEVLDATTYASWGVVSCLTRWKVETLVSVLSLCRTFSRRTAATPHKTTTRLLRSTARCVSLGLGGGFHPLGKNFSLPGDALNKTGRHIWFDVCGWYSWYAPVGQGLANSWRIGPDDTTWSDILTNIDINSELKQYAGPGGW